MTTIYREALPEDRRAKHTGRLFGAAFPLRLEPLVFTIAGNLARRYEGGYWEFYALSNGGFYMAPSSDVAFQVVCENGFAGSLSADALGLTACLYAYSHLSFSDTDEVWADQYHLLRDYALGHGETSAILAAID